MLYQTKPKYMNAIQWHGDNIDEVNSFFDTNFTVTNNGQEQYLLSGPNNSSLIVYMNDYLFANNNGNITVNSARIFEQCYEPVPISKMDVVANEYEKTMELNYISKIY